MSRERKDYAHERKIINIDADACGPEKSAAKTSRPSVGSDAKTHLEACIGKSEFLKSSLACLDSKTLSKRLEALSTEFDKAKQSVQELITQRKEEEKAKKVLDNAMSMEPALTGELIDAAKRLNALESAIISGIDILPVEEVSAAQKELDAEKARKKAWDDLQEEEANAWKNSKAYKVPTQEWLQKVEAALSRAKGLSIEKRTLQFAEITKEKQQRRMDGFTQLQVALGVPEFEEGRLSTLKLALVTAAECGLTSEELKPAEEVKEAEEYKELIRNKLSVLIKRAPDREGDEFIEKEFRKKIKGEKSLLDEAQRLNLSGALQDAARKRYDDSVTRNYHRREIATELQMPENCHNHKALSAKLQAAKQSGMFDDEELKPAFEFQSKLERREEMRAKVRQVQEQLASKSPTEATLDELNGLFVQARSVSLNEGELQPLLKAVEHIKNVVEARGKLQVRVAKAEAFDSSGDDVDALRAAIEACRSLGVTDLTQAEDSLSRAKTRVDARECMKQALQKAEAKNSDDDDGQCLQELLQAQKEASKACLPDQEMKELEQAMKKEARAREVHLRERMESLEIEVDKAEKSCHLAVQDDLDEDLMVALDTKFWKKHAEHEEAKKHLECHYQNFEKYVKRPSVPALSNSSTDTPSEDAAKSQAQGRPKAKVAAKPPKEETALAVVPRRENRLVKMRGSVLELQKEPSTVKLIPASSSGDAPREHGVYDKAQVDAVAGSFSWASDVRGSFVLVVNVDLLEKSNCASVREGKGIELGQKVVEKFSKKYSGDWIEKDTETSDLKFGTHVMNREDVPASWKNFHVRAGALGGNKQSRANALGYALHVLQQHVESQTAHAPPGIGLSHEDKAVLSHIAKQAPKLQKRKSAASAWHQEDWRSKKAR